MKIDTTMNTIELEPHEDTWVESGPHLFHINHLTTYSTIVVYPNLDDLTDVNPLQELVFRDKEES